MALRLIVSLGLMLIYSEFVELSPIPILVEETRPNQNQLEDLFFMSEQEEKSLENNAVNNSVIEKVKARLLKSLNLKEAPKSHPPAPPLQIFLPQDNSWSGYAKNTSAGNSRRDARSEFFHSEIVPNTCFDRKGAQCLRFQISLENLSTAENETSAEIWLFKKQGVVQFNMTLLSDEPGRQALRREYYHIFNQSETAEWIRLDATLLLSGVTSGVLDLEVYSEASFAVPIETGREKNPILIVLRDSKRNSRRVKRSTGECEEGVTSCCMKSLYVSFKEIGWDSWIVQPEGYSANICKGSCENRMDLAEKHHSTIMILMMSKGKKNSSEISESIHCTPKEYKPLSIIYTAESGLRVIRKLPNMSVSECSCS